ncbi:Gram-negative bacterial tonB protein [compost metagenome]
MSNLNIFKQSWNEIVFEGRNKEYGAYQLRQENPRTTLKALFFGILACASLLSIPVISGLLKKEVPNVTDAPYVLPDAILVNTEIFKKTKPEASAKKSEPEKSSEKQIKNVTPTVTDAKDTPNEVQEIDPTKSIKTGDSDNPGDNKGNIALGNSSSDGKGNETTYDSGTTKGNDTGNEILNIGVLQANPEFPGGIKNFLALVGEKFKTPEIDEQGIMKIFVYFVVEKDGTLSNIKVLRDPGYGLGEEAIRVLKSIKTKWKPGIQNDKPVRTAYNLPISVDIKNN